MTWEENRLMHFGILGQKWGVRRFQNEDGTLTEEGRRRYLQNYEKTEREADETIKRAQNQIADIDKNGWNARSAFAPQFVKQVREEGMMNDYNLNFFKKQFERDISEAKLNKKVAQEARSFLEKNASVTYDDILRESIKTDNKHKSDLEERNRKIGDELGLEEKTKKIDVWKDDKALKDLKKKYSTSELKDLVNQATSAIKKQVGRDALSEMKVNGEPFNSLPIEEQALIVMQLFNVQHV